MITVTMVLAQGPGLPGGNLDDKLTLHLKLTQQGQIDLDAYNSAAAPWLATRDRHGAEPHSLEIVRVDEGWALQSTRSEDDPFWTFEGHVFRPGELVSLRQPDGQTLLFRIVQTESE